MDIRAKTKEFQKQVSKSLTELFDKNIVHDNNIKEFLDTLKTALIKKIEQDD